MIYTSGIVLNPDIEETLEQLQDNKLAVVCSKLDLKPTDKYVNAAIITLNASEFEMKASRHWLRLGYPCYLCRQEFRMRCHWCYSG